MDIDEIKTEQAIDVKEENDRNEKLEMKLEDEEKPQALQMDNESIKIEPSIVVKKGLELDSDEKFELKLKDEKKPQIINEFSEEKPSSTFENVETNSQSCCYCGKKKKLEEMTLTPENHDDLLKWSRILGRRLHENAHSSKPSKICRSHFDDEFGDSRLINVVNENGDVETKLDDKVKCCYCGRLRMRRSTTNVKKNTNYFAKWTEILGKEFRKYFERNKNGRICRSHFNVEWYGARPIDILPVASLLDNSKEDEPNRNLVATPKMNLNKRINLETERTCCYCGDSKPAMMMTQVPKTTNKFKKWADILGDEFYKKALSKYATYICRSHFDFEWEDRRPGTALPCVQPIQELSNKVKKEVAMNFTIQERPSDSKKIKIEVKEEEEEETS